MSSSKGIKTFLPLVLLGALMSLVFLFLGAPILRVLRNVFGSFKYWSAGFFLFAILYFVGLAPLGFLLISTWLVVGIYGELEERGWSSFWTGLFAVCFSTFFCILGANFWCHSIGSDLNTELGSFVENILKQSKTYNTNDNTMLSGLSVDKSFVVSQMPSVLFIMNMTSLAFGLMLDRKTALLFNLRFERVASGLKLIEFRAPDFLIWVAMLSFLGSFLKLNNESATYFFSNIVNVVFGIYFFQGLAVIESTLLYFRAGTIMRLLVYFIIVGQLFLLVSIVGIIDFWADFRGRLRKFITKEKHKNGEQI